MVDWLNLMKRSWHTIGIAWAFSESILAKNQFNSEVRLRPGLEITVCPEFFHGIFAVVILRAGGLQPLQQTLMRRPGGLFAQ